MTYAEKRFGRGISTYTHVPMPLAAGTRLGPYEVVAALGAGGMGEVYRATDCRLGRDVAIKILPETFAADADRRARFEREARVVAALNHPNIVVLHSVEDVDGIRFLTMELVEGQSLDQHLKPGCSAPIMGRSTSGPIAPRTRRTKRAWISDVACRRAPSRKGECPLFPYKRPPDPRTYGPTRAMCSSSDSTLLSAVRGE